MCIRDREIAVQINGKTKATISIGKEDPKDDVLAKAKEALGDKLDVYKRQRHPHCYYILLLVADQHHGPFYLASSIMISLLRATNSVISSAASGLCANIARSYNCLQNISCLLYTAPAIRIFEKTPQLKFLEINRNNTGLSLS